jgi:hypothetical protein
MCAPRAVTRCTGIGKGGWPSFRNMASLSAARSRLASILRQAGLTSAEFLNLLD